MKKNVTDESKQQKAVDEQNGVNKSDALNGSICAEPPVDPKEFEQVREACEKAQAEAKSCMEEAKRIQAEFENYRKRTNSVAEEMKLFGQSTVIEKMLTVLDNCDLARKYVQDEAALTGFNMMEAQILNALSGFGLEVIDAEGQDFDAKLMNAVERIESEEYAGKVAEVMLKGYTLKGKLLRPASVKVGFINKTES